jgi:hypothetical protein
VEKQDARLALHCNRLAATARGASLRSFTRAKAALVQDDIDLPDENTAAEIDFLVAYEEPERTWYVIPVKALEGM